MAVASARAFWAVVPFKSCAQQQGLHQVLQHGYNPNLITQRGKTTPGLSAEVPYFSQIRNKIGTKGRCVSGHKLWFHLEASEDSWTFHPSPLTLPEATFTSLPTLPALQSRPVASSAQEPLSPSHSCCHVSAWLMPECATPQQWAPSYLKSLLSQGYSAPPAFSSLPLLVHLGLASLLDRVQ